MRGRISRRHLRRVTIEIFFLWELQAGPLEQKLICMNRDWGSRNRTDLIQTVSRMEAGRQVKSASVDLRIRVLGVVAAGATHRQVGERFR